MTTKPTQTDIQGWFINQISKELDMNPTEVDIDTPIATFGVDSITMVQFATQAESWLSIDIDPATLYKYPTIKDISAFLYQKLG